MHVLPLPFGLALALVPRREADSFGRRARARNFDKTVHVREQILGDMKYLHTGRYIL